MSTLTFAGRRFKEHLGLVLQAGAFNNVIWRQLNIRKVASYSGCDLVWYAHPVTSIVGIAVTVLELLLPFEEGLKYGDEIKLSILAEQMIIEGAKT